MDKIFADKYYTPPTVAKFCIEKAYEIIGKENITEIIEPSAGCGSFSLQIPNCKAYDLYPQSEYIEQADFLKLDLGGYKKGRLFIGNPPFGGSVGKLISDFYNKCTKEGDYIAFILPANYHNNYKRFYKFEIIYSVLITDNYSNRKIKSSFVIYKKNNEINDFRAHFEHLKDISIEEYKRSNKFENRQVKCDYDYCICGYGMIFKECNPYQYASTFTIKINNKELKNEIISFFKWIYNYENETHFIGNKCVGSKNISIKTITELLRICIPQIK